MRHRKSQTHTAGEPDARTETFTPLIALAPFAIVWIALCAHLAAHWRSNPQYSFGWLVPLVALYLAVRRWETRPSPGASRRAWLVGALALISFLLLPTWLVAQPNPDWRLISWTLAFETIALSLCAVMLWGGTPWARHFAFPLCFILTAVPWPSGIEQPVIQGLMRAVAAVTVELLNLFGTPALQHGNLIEIGRGVLGVDEACSGVRSLQSTLMVSLFLGEFYWFGLGRRTLLLAGGIVAAFLTNVGRTYLLAATAARSGIESVARWHDPAGFTILTICFVAVWLLALVIDQRQHPLTPVRERRTASPMPLTVSVSLMLWLVAVFAGTEWWFRTAPPTEMPSWRFAPPEASTPVAIEPRAVEMLQYDSGTARQWRDQAGRRWIAFFFEWLPGPSRSRLLAQMHRPEECLPAGGFRLVSDRGTVGVKVAAADLAFRAHVFEQHGRFVFVYFCLAQSGGSGAERKSTQRAGLDAVVRRERNLGQQILELVLFDCASAEEADAALREALPELVRRR